MTPKPRIGPVVQRLPLLGRSHGRPRGLQRAEITRLGSPGAARVVRRASICRVVAFGWGSAHRDPAFWRLKGYRIEAGRYRPQRDVFSLYENLLAGGSSPGPLTRANPEAIAWPVPDWTSRTVVRAPSGYA